MLTVKDKVYKLVKDGKGKVELLLKAEVNPRRPEAASSGWGRCR